MYIGNVLLLVLNLPLISLWVKILKVPYGLLFPMILFFLCIIGAYTVNNSTTDVGIMLLFGVVGYLMKKFDYEPAPMILAFVLSPILERSLREIALDVERELYYFRKAADLVGLPGPGRRSFVFGIPADDS